MKYTSVIIELNIGTYLIEVWKKHHDDKDGGLLNKSKRRKKKTKWNSFTKKYSVPWLCSQPCQIVWDIWTSMITAGTPSQQFECLIIIIPIETQQINLS